MFEGDEHSSKDWYAYIAELKEDKAKIDAELTKAYAGYKAAKLYEQQQAAITHTHEHTHTTSSTPTSDDPNKTCRTAYETDAYGKIWKVTYCKSCKNALVKDPITWKYTFKQVCTQETKESKEACSYKYVYDPKTWKYVRKLVCQPEPEPTPAPTTPTYPVW